MAGTRQYWQRGIRIASPNQAAIPRACARTKPYHSTSMTAPRALFQGRQLLRRLVQLPDRSVLRVVHLDKAADEGSAFKRLRGSLLHCRQRGLDGLLKTGWQLF